MAFVTTTSPDLYATTSNLEEIPAGADPLQYMDDDKANQILVALTALHGWASGVPVSETANGHFLALAAGSSAAVSIAGGVRIRNNAGALDYSYNTGAYARLLSKLTLASQATGDIMYASAADTWTRLAAGTNGYVLTMSGGLPVWAAGGGGGGLSSPVGAADGGTGITSYAVGDIIYASGATTLSKLADVATGNALISGGVTTAPAWGKIGLTTHVSGTLPAANGGTGQGGGYAVGDMLYASGASALSKLAAVAVGQMLISTGVTTAPAWSAAGVLTSLTLTSGSSMKLLAWTSDTKYLAFAEAAGSPSYRGIKGQEGSGTDVAGGDLRLLAGQSTGAAAGGDVEVWHSLRTTGSDAVLNTAAMTWEFTAPTDVGDGTGVAHSDLLPAVTAKNYLGSTSKRLISGYFDTQAFANKFGSADDTNSYWEFDESDGASITLGGTSRHKVSATFARYAMNGATYADSSIFEVRGASGDCRGRFDCTASATATGGVVASGDSGQGLTVLLDGTSTTRTGVANGSFFVGLTSQAHFGALTNTDSHWITGTADSSADRVASAIYNAGNRYLKIGYFVEYTEMSAPAAGAANTARVFAVDSGGGKTVLKVQFATGAAQTIATEP